ncbi:MAG: hypothetical protein ABFS02_05775 [Pseudomonadota bacterium]
MFKQDEIDALSACEQIVVLFALNHGLFDGMELTAVSTAEKFLRGATKKLPDQCAKIQRGEALDENDQEVIVAIAREILCQGGE